MPRRLTLVTPQPEECCFITETLTRPRRYCQPHKRKNKCSDRSMEVHYLPLYPGACRGFVFGGAIATTLSSPGVKPTLSAPNFSRARSALKFSYSPGKSLSASVKMRKQIWCYGIYLGAQHRPRYPVFVWTPLSEPTSLVQRTVPWASSFSSIINRTWGDT